MPDEVAVAQGTMRTQRLPNGKYQSSVGRDVRQRLLPASDFTVIHFSSACFEKMDHHAVARISTRCRVQDSLTIRSKTHRGSKASSAR